MRRKSKSDLSTKDIEFLKGVAEVEANAEKFEGTDRSARPANKSVLKRVTNLSETELRYRMEEDRRGFEEIGYIEIYDPQPTQSGYTPRSVELTDTGRKAIEAWEQKHGEVNTEGWDDTTVEEMEATVSRLESKVDRLSSRNEELEHEIERVRDRNDQLESAFAEVTDSEYGALDDEKVDVLQAAVQRMNAHHWFIQNVLESSLTDEYDAEKEEEYRREVRGALLSSNGGD